MAAYPKVGKRMLVWHSLRRKLPRRALSGGSHGPVRRTARGVAEPLELLVSRSGLFLADMIGDELLDLLPGRI